MKKTKHRTRRSAARPAFGALAALVWLMSSAPAMAIQFPNNLFIPATGCSNPAISGVLCSTGNPASPGYLDTNFVVAGSPHDPRAVYRYLGATDGAALMADGTPLYTFGFLDLTNVPLSYITGTVPVASNAYLGVTGVAGTSPVSITETGIPQKLLPPGDTSVNAEVTYQGKANWIAPDLVFNEGDHVYLNLVNLGMRERMDLPDAHTIHWHGQPNAAPQFDGEPMASWGINMSLTPVPVSSTGMPKTPEARDFTYFVVASHPGTFLYHCHMEATEHMEMGMLGHLIVRPAQDVANGGSAHTFNGRSYSKFAYNDCATGLATTLCGTTGYDVEMFLQLADFDPLIHGTDATYGAAAPNFALFTPAYPMMNGRGYPDTLRPDNDATFLNNMSGITFNPTSQPPAANYVSQKKSSLITINKTGGQRTALVRLVDLSVQFPYNLRSEIPFRVVGKDANLLAGPTGTDLTYSATSVFIGPGETYDLILDVTNVPTGTYFLYARELLYLNNNGMDRGGTMTEIHVN